MKMNKKQMMGVALLVIILTVTTIPVITKAQSPYIPTKDIWCEAFPGGGCLNGFGLSTISQQASCNTQRVAFIGWDLSALTQTIGSAELVLTSYFISQAPVPPNELEFELFIPSTQDWTEATTSSPGDSGAALATKQISLDDGSVPQEVVFGGIENQDDATALGAYFDNLKASGSATIGVRITGGCLENTVVNFNDREQSGGTAAAQPSLFLFTPTAVSLSTLNATDQGAVGGVTAVVVVGLLGLVVVGVLIGWPRLRRKQRAE